MSLPEGLVWQELRRRQAEGVYFRRQHPLGPYVLDFYCARARLAIEIDGARHGEDDRHVRDQARDRWLAARGVLRLAAGDVLRDVESAVGAIYAEVSGSAR